MKISIFDIEANGLNADKIWCLATNTKTGQIATHKYDQMVSFLTSAEVLVGHNIIRYDIPTLERILNIKITARLVDTLALSWYLEPERDRHGLEEYGEEFGVPKPVIEDWNNLSVEEYEHRCKEDVRINTRLWNRQWNHLLRIYETEEDAWRLIDYLSFKMDCAAQQEADKWRLDVDKATKLVYAYTEEYNGKVEELRKAMPKKLTYKPRTKPDKMFLKNKIGVLSKAGERWLELLKENNLPEDYDSVIQELVKEEDGNPGSHDQIKAWLYSLGWVPESFEYKRNKETNELRKIPQIKNKQDDSGGICASVKALFELEPRLEILDGMSVLSHRISILTGFLEAVDERGYIKAQIAGFTNTLRFKHKTVVNLPGVDKPYGADIRGCLIATEGFELCGSDMSSLEDRTKQHYMFPYDPEYVKEMQTEGYDPHLSLAVFAGELSKEQADDHINKRASYRTIRQTYKSVNYACVYGARPPRVAITAKCSVPRAETLVDAYWKRNWSVLKIAEDCTVKTVRGQKWLLNPVSKLWYSLRYEKDRFSTLNQGTGVYCFDTWIKHIRSKRPQLTGQFHDECILTVKKGNRDKAEELLRWAISEANKELNLNVKLGIDIQFGENYASVH